MRNTQAERTQQALALYEAMTPEMRAQFMEIMRMMKAQQDMQRESIRQAINHASVADIKHGAEVLE